MSSLRPLEEIPETGFGKGKNFMMKVRVISFVGKEGLLTFAQKARFGPGHI